MYEEERYAEIIEKATSLKQYLNEPEKEALAFFLIDSYFWQKEYTVVINDGSKFLSDYPKSSLVPKIHMLIGYSYTSLGYDANTVEHMRDILQKHEKSPWLKKATQSLGDSLYRLKKYAAAVRVYEFFFRKLEKPFVEKQGQAKLDIYQSLYFYALSCFFLHKFDMALGVINRALMGDFGSEEMQSILYTKVNILMSMMRFREAHVLIDKVLVKYPEKGSWFQKFLYKKILIGMKLQEYKKVRENLDLYQSFVEMDEMTSGALDHQRALSFFYEGKYNEAIDIWDKINVRIKPKWLKEAMFLKGLALYNILDYEKAIDQLQKCLHLYPEKASRVYYYQGWAWISLGNIDEALRLFMEMLKNHPQDPLMPDVLFWMAENALLNGDQEEHHKLLNKIIDNYPKNDLVGDAHFDLAKSKFLMGEWKEALEHLEQIQANHVVYRESLLMRMNVYLHQGRYERVINSLTPLVNDEDVLILRQNMAYLLGRAYMGLKNGVRAEEYFKQSMYGHEGPIIVLSMFALADALFCQQLWTEALNAYVNVQSRMLKFKAEEIYFKAKLGEARCFQKLEKYGAAMTVYRDIISMKNTKFRSIAKEMIDLLSYKQRKI